MEWLIGIIIGAVLIVIGGIVGGWMVDDYHERFTFKSLRADRDQWRRKLTAMIAELKGFIAEARLSHTCEHCPPSVTVADLEFAIEEADDE